MPALQEFHDSTLYLIRAETAVLIVPAISLNNLLTKICSVLPSTKIANFFTPLYAPHYQILLSKIESQKNQSYLTQ